ncbi:23S rRNA methyltransferase [bacterium BMS3Abin14]|nr:23S rRNA methyltransferase [bacterium BMS3Abin14]
MGNLPPLPRERRRTIRSLASRKIRRRKGLCLVEGQRAIEEAARSGHLEYLVAEDPAVLAGLEVGQAGGMDQIPVFLADGALFEDVSDVVHHRNLLGVARLPAEPEISPLLQMDGRAVLLFLDGVQDPGNVGALIRSAWVLGGAGILVGRGTADPFGHKAVRASAGGIFHLPVFMEVGREDLISLSGAGFRVYLAKARERSFGQVDFAPRSILAVGNEGSGLSPWMVELGTPVSVPLCTEADSLNVVVAGSILLWAMLSGP